MSSTANGFGMGFGLIIGIVVALILLPILVCGGCASGCAGLAIVGGVNQAREAQERARAKNDANAVAQQPEAKPRPNPGMIEAPAAAIPNVADNAPAEKAAAAEPNEDVVPATATVDKAKVASEVWVPIREKLASATKWDPAFKDELDAFVIAHKGSAEASQAERELKAAGKLKLAQSLFDKGQKGPAKKRFQEIVREQPGTLAAREAKALSDTID